MTDLRHIPLTFIAKRQALSWPEAWVGIREDWLTRPDAIQLALDHLEGGKNDDVLAELAGTSERDTAEVAMLVERLAHYQPFDESEIRLAWFRLLLAWIYANRNVIDDPLAVIEGLYADFGYPEEAYDLIRHNPPRVSRESSITGDDQLYLNWSAYLDRVFPSCEPHEPHSTT